MGSTNSIPLCAPLACAPLERGTPNTSSLEQRSALEGVEIAAEGSAQEPSISTASAPSASTSARGSRLNSVSLVPLCSAPLCGDGCLRSAPLDFRSHPCLAVGACNLPQCHPSIGSCASISSCTPRCHPAPCLACSSQLVSATTALEPCHACSSQLVSATTALEPCHACSLGARGQQPAPRFLCPAPQAISRIESLPSTRLHFADLFSAEEVKQMLRDGDNLYSRLHPSGPTALAVAEEALHSPRDCPQWALLRSAARPWCPQRNELFPSQSRHLAFELVMLGHAIAQLHVRKHAVVVEQLWLTEVMPFVLSRTSTEEPQSAVNQLQYEMVC